MSVVNPDSSPEEQPEVSEEATVDGAIGYIHIDITDTAVSYDSKMSLPEIVLWMKVVETMILKKIVAE